MIAFFHCRGTTPAETEWFVSRLDVIKILEDCATASIVKNRNGMSQLWCFICYKNCVTLIHTNILKQTKKNKRLKQPTGAKRPQHYNYRHRIRCMRYNKRCRHRESSRAQAEASMPASYTLWYNLFLRFFVYNFVMTSVPWKCALKLHCDICELPFLLRSQ